MEKKKEKDFDGGAKREAESRVLPKKRDQETK